MEFVLIGYDGKDSEALSRRTKARDAHIEGSKKLKKEGHLVSAGAMLDDDEKMIGSIVVYDYPSREELDNMLKTEPYITGNVWEKIIIKPYKIAIK